VTKLIYRQQRNYENLNKAFFDGKGEYDIPSIKPTFASAQKFIGFNYAKTCKDRENTGVHFFVDDYQFLRLWTHPDAYLGSLRQFKCVCTPDFSMYTDFPKAVQIYNHYRKHWLGAYWQQQGITVIPTISWSDEDSFEWCFDGEPLHSIVAVSSVGTQQSKQGKQLFEAGFKEMVSRLEPSGILFYGAVPESCEMNNLIRLDSFQNGIKKRIAEKDASEALEAHKAV
jgi:hypothetical protein